MLNIIRLVLWLKKITISLLTIKLDSKYKFQQECQVDYLFVSHLVNNSQYDSGNDFYFSDTFGSLLNANKTSFVALLNPKNVVHSANQGAFGDGITPHFVLFEQIKIKR